MLRGRELKLASIEALRKRVERLKREVEASKGRIREWRGRRVVPSDGWDEWRQGAFDVFPSSFVPIFGEPPEGWMRDWIDLLVELKDHDLGRWRCFDCVLRRASELRLDVERRRRLRDEDKEFYEGLSPGERQEFDRQNRLKVTEYRLYNDLGEAHDRVCPLDEDKMDFFRCPFGEEAEKLVQDGRLIESLWRHLDWYNHHHWRSSIFEPARDKMKWYHYDETPIVDPADYDDVLRAIDDGRIIKVVEEHEAYMKEKELEEKRKKKT